MNSYLINNMLKQSIIYICYCICYYLPYMRYSQLDCSIAFRNRSECIVKYIRFVYLFMPWYCILSVNVEYYYISD